MTDRSTHYQYLADYYGERAEEANTRYLNTGHQLDKVWAGYFLRFSLAYTAKLHNLTANEWIPAAVGCHWTRGPYTISTVVGGNEPSGYVVYLNHQQVGPRYPTFADAAASTK